jgi:uncharacterized membrane protein YhaH (DUF805 family)
MAAKREPPSAQRPLAGQHYWTPLAIFAYEVAAMWPLFAITAKRLHDNGRSLTLAMLAAVALPFADAATLASDYGALDTAPVAISRLPAILIFCTWTGLMWYIYRLPSSSGANRFGLPPADPASAGNAVPIAPRDLGLLLKRQKACDDAFDAERRKFSYLFGALQT